MFVNQIEAVSDVQKYLNVSWTYSEPNSNVYNEVLLYSYTWFI